MKIQAPVMVKIVYVRPNWFFVRRSTNIWYIHPSCTGGQLVGHLDDLADPTARPTRGSQLNDVAVNASGLTVAAWDQYNFYTLFLLASALPSNPGDGGARPVHSPALRSPIRFPMGVRGELTTSLARQPRPAHELFHDPKSL